MARESQFEDPRQAAGVSSLALIGNASAHKVGAKSYGLSRGIFDKETRRKPLAFAADAAPMAIRGCFGTFARQDCWWCVWVNGLVNTGAVSGPVASLPDNYHL